MIAAPLIAQTAADAPLFSAALLTCPENLAIVEKGHLVWVNAGFAEMYQYHNPSALQGRGLGEFVPGRRACTETAGHHRDCGYSSCEFEARRSNGQSITVQACCAPFQVGNRDFLVITARNVSQQERRRILRCSEQRYRTIFEAAAIGIVQCAMDGRIVECNPAGQRMLGRSRAAIRELHFHDLLHADDVPQNSRLFHDIAGGARDGYQIELRYVRADQGIGWARVTMSLVRGPDRNAEYAIAMMEDITEAKRAEQELRAAHKIEAVGRLVGGVAHDFNNLLTGIMLYCDLLLAGLARRSRLRHHAEEIRTASSHGAALIAQLLSLARQQPSEPRVLSFNDLILDMRGLLARLIGENIELITDLADDLRAVRMDPAQGQQIILNLALNARDAMPDGGRVSIRTRNSSIAAESCDPRELTPGIEISVSDTGCGMDEQTRAHLFEPFFTTKGPGQGSGLGLATVHSIIRQHGGSIAVESQTGKGTQVLVRLPPADEQPDRAAPPVKVARAGLKGHETILLVEDDKPVREAARRVLARYGYQVLEASSGSEASHISKTHDGDIELLIADLMMPGMSGREVAKRVRELRPQMKVLYISGYDPAPEADSQKEVLLFRKPFTADSLARRVREILDQHDKLAELEEVSHDARRSHPISSRSN